MAVAFFFVLGGFCMALGYKDKVLNPDFCYCKYLTRRCIKFFPLHWICLLVVLPLSYGHFRLWLIPVFFSNAALVHTWIPVDWVYFSFNDVSWYLADTMFFALLFPIIFKRLAESSLEKRIMIASLIVLFYLITAVSIPSQMHHAILYISPIVRLLDFIFGIFLAFLYFSVKDIHSKWMHNSIIIQLIIFVAISFLMIESCIISEDTRLFAPIYWPMIAVVILTASLSSWGGAIIGKQSLVVPWRTKLYNIYDS